MTAKEHPRVSDLLNEKTLSKARHVEPGTAGLLTVKAGQYLQIQTIEGKQVADFVAFNADDLGEYVSTSHTRAANMNIVPQMGMSLFTNLRQPLFEITEDTVGRHDMLVAACDRARYEALGAPGHASCREALSEALREFEVGYERMPDPINWFMNVSIKQKGELDVRAPLAEAGDYVLLKALRDAVVAVSACPQDLNDTNGGKPTALRLAVYRDDPLPQGIVVPAGGAGAALQEPELAASVDGDAPVAQLEPGPEAEQLIALDAVADEGTPEPNPVLVQEAFVATADSPEAAVVAEAAEPAQAESTSDDEATEKAQPTA
jgi:uncharacterized protein YcgI (DUF1989 family)